MSARKKTKLCWHCHGTIAAEATHCAYCGERSELPRAQPHSYFPPDVVEIEETPQESPQTPQQSLKGDAMSSRLSSAKTWLSSQISEFTSRDSRQRESSPSPIPLLCFIYGIFLAICAISLRLFAKGGVLQLEFRASWWWVYLCLASLLIWSGSLYFQSDSDQEKSSSREHSTPLEGEHDAH